MKHKIIIAAGMVFLLIGCTTTSGARVDKDKLSQIKKGVTTEKEVIALLGKPNSRSSTSDGETILGYSYTKGKVRASTFIPVVNIFTGGVDSEFELLTVMIDKNGKVWNYGTSESTASMNSGILNTQ